jgi:hypothetical protein
MNKLMCVALTAAMTMPLAAFAQTSSGHVTRAEVRAELTQLEAVGYRPSTHDADYPQALQRAEAKVAGLDAYGGAHATTHAATQASGAAHIGEPQR